MLGWVDAKVAGITVEIEDSHKPFNHQICSEAGGGLGAVQPNQLKAVTLCWQSHQLCSPLDRAGSPTSTRPHHPGWQIELKLAPETRPILAQGRYPWDYLPGLEQGGRPSMARVPADDSTIRECKLRKQEHELQMQCRLRAL